MRVDDLKDVAERPPLILYADNRQTDKIVLHIALKQGSIVRAGGQWDTIAQVTECNRIAEYWHIWGGYGEHKWLSVEEFLKVNGDDYRLCARCGGLDDFEKALEGFRINRKRIEEERAERLRVERQAEQKIRIWKEVELELFMNKYVTTDAPLDRVSQFRYEYRVPNSGIVITLKVGWEDDK